jgi:putative transposase
MTDAIRQIGMSEVTYYRWRQEFGGLRIEQVKRMKEIELENSRLRYVDQLRRPRWRPDPP